MYILYHILWRKCFGHFESRLFESEMKVQTNGFTQSNGKMPTCNQYSLDFCIPNNYREAKIPMWLHEIMMKVQCEGLGCIRVHATHNPNGYRWIIIFCMLSMIVIKSKYNLTKPIERTNRNRTKSEKRIDRWQRCQVFEMFEKYLA